MIGHPLGSPDNPLDRAQRLDKFRRCLAHGGVGAADRLIDILESLEDLPDVRALTAAAV